MPCHVKCPHAMPACCCSMCMCAGKKFGFIAGKKIQTKITLPKMFFRQPLLRKLAAATLVTTIASQSFAHAEPQTTFSTEEKADAYKEYFAKSYDQVAAVVQRREQEQDVLDHLRRTVARVLMERLGYSKEELAIIGDDVDKMQGTGNPFPHAALQPGDIVLDLGSGFGIDAELAGSKVGEEGRVLGVDLSIEEVSNANRRIVDKGIKNVRFYNMDIERLVAIPDESIDVVISNGGFCLVPNKRRAFQEIKRVLKPQGRFSISCTTLRSGYGSINKFMSDEKAALEEDFPSCMEVFMPIDAAQPLLLDLGFENVQVDASNSKMSVWDDVEKEMQADVDKELAKLHGLLPKGDAKVVEAQEAEEMATMVLQGQDKEVGTSETSVGVHTKNPKYAHLSSLSMDDICARVVLVGRKPLDAPVEV